MSLTMWTRSPKCQQILTYRKEPGVWQQAHDREANGVVWQILRHPRLHKETLKRNGGWGVLGL